MSSEIERFSNFLLEVSENREYLTAYKQNPDKTLAEWGFSPELQHAIKKGDSTVLRRIMPTMFLAVTKTQ